MTTLVFVRRFLTDYVRNPVNLLLLAVVPVVFVVVVADAMADAAKLLGGPGGPAVETATAGWAAGFLAAIGMYFQTAATRDADRRVVIAGLRAARLVAARLATGLILALLAVAVAVTALSARSGIDAPARVVAGTLMFAVIYLAIGAVVGATVPNPVNGTVVILFVWILDVFFGPAMGAKDWLATRVLPTHFVTLWMVDLPSGHGGQIGDIGWALAWTAAAVAGAWALTTARLRTARLRRRVRPGGIAAQLAAASRAAWRDARRNPALWVLFVVVPVVFILTADAVTPNAPILLTVTEHGRRAARTFNMADVHGATMAPIAVASLAALVGLFTVLDSRDSDRRAALAGLRPGALLTARLGTLTVAALAATAVSLAATAMVFHATRWPTYAAANLLTAFTYALVGALLGPMFGRVGGVFVAFLLPFLDVGIAQSPMLNPEPTTLSRLLPGYGGSRILIDGALTSGFDETRPLLVGLAWLVALAVAVTLAYRHASAPTRSP
ncbi:MAG: ABC transporter permease [Actinobacteria bacterium]|nr:ABC transporter permease [Actinomycetota bacterium]MBI3685909.1 ABC transporter permease [Actinomycetota bacterium]